MADVPRFERKTAFRVYNTADQLFTSGGGFQLIDYNTVAFDLGSNFNLTTNAYIAPIDGLYHFTATLETIPAASGAGRVLIALLVNGAERARGDELTVRDFGSGDFNLWQVNTITLLEMGDTVTTHFFPVSGPNQTGDGDASGARTYFAGYRIQSESRTILN